MPAPPGVKQATIRRNAVHGGTFVETGTFFGDTSAFARGFSKRVITIEPADELYRAAVRRFSGSATPVEVINAPSEEALPALVPHLQGDVTFWLDGHYSGGVTYEGADHTPLLRELDCLGPHVSRLDRLSILIDDVRECGLNPTYPPLAKLLQWAGDHAMTWHIEHDILVLRKPNR